MSILGRTLFYLSVHVFPEGFFSIRMDILLCLNRVNNCLEAYNFKILSFSPIENIKIKLEQIV